MATSLGPTLGFELATFRSQRPSDSTALAGEVSTRDIRRFSHIHTFKDIPDNTMNHPSIHLPEALVQHEHASPE